MTEQELNVFLDLEWNCAAFTPEEASVSAPLFPKQRATGSGALNTTRGFGITIHAKTSSRNRCGGVFFTVQPSCCQIAHTFTCSAMRSGADSTIFRN